MERSLPAKNSGSGVKARNGAAQFSFYLFESSQSPRFTVLKGGAKVGKVRVLQVLIILSALVGLFAIQSARPRRGVLTSKAY